jgi:hypothetical protein
MKRMRKCNDEVYQLAKDQALVKKLKNKRSHDPKEPIGNSYLAIHIHEV